MKLLTSLCKRAGIKSLLSAINSNPKVAKNSKLGVLTAVLHLAPGNMSGFEVCTKRSPGCSNACLHFAGSPLYLTGKTQARIARTKVLFQDRNLFFNILALEIADHISLAESKGMIPAVRLNGTSDICWEAKKFILFPETKALLGDRYGSSIIEIFSDIQFYDYTAIPHRKIPANYDLTFSLKEQNMNEAKAALAQGLNLAVVFADRLPETFLGYPVVNGDEHDYRPADPRGCIVGLKVKGRKGKEDMTGFVQTESDTLAVAA